MRCILASAVLCAKVDFLLRKSENKENFRVYLYYEDDWKVFEEFQRIKGDTINVIEDGCPACHGPLTYAPEAADGAHGDAYIVQLDKSSRSYRYRNQVNVYEDIDKWR